MDQAQERRSTSSTAGRVLRDALVALVPPALAFGGEVMFFSSLGARWLLMVAAVIVSAANGGMLTGLVATMVSAALVWWFLVPPIHTLGAIIPAHYLAVALFLMVGYAISLLHERLHRTNAGLARVARQNQIFAALIDNSFDFIGIADADGTPVYLNPAGRRMVELPSSVDIRQTQIRDYYPSAQRAFAEQTILAEMIGNGKWAGETSFRNWRTGDAIPVLDSHFLIRDRTTEQPIGMATITRDISTQKAQRDELERANERLSQTMAALEESQRSLQGILDNSPNAIVLKAADGRYTVVNNAFAALTRRRPSDVHGRSDADLFAPSLAQRLRANDERALASRNGVVTEEALDVDGSEHVFVVAKFPLLDEAQKILSLGAIWTDITQRKRDEEALRQAASELRTAQRVACVGSWRWDLRTNEAKWSDELYRIFRLDPSHARRPSLLVAHGSPLTEESRRRLQSAVDETRADGSSYALDLEFTRADGSTGWVAARGEAVRDEAGHVIGINGTAADITKLKELQRLRDEWTSVIAHDLRQPIGTILMASGMLPELHETKSTKDERAFVERIQAAARSLRRMVDDLLDMSLLEADRLKLDQRIVDPSTLVHESLERLAHLPGIARVRVEMPTNLSPVFVDPMRIEQVLDNLVSNAIKYGDHETEIIISLEQREKEIHIAVTNHGIGIPPDELPRLFDRFVRSRTTRGSGVSGLGLGLYIAKGVMTAHGGRLWAESTPGKTTTFHAVLPISAEQQQAA